MVSFKLLIAPILVTYSSVISLDLNIAKTQLRNTFVYNSLTPVVLKPHIRNTTLYYKWILPRIIQGHGVIVKKIRWYSVLMGESFDVVKVVNKMPKWNTFPYMQCYITRFVTEYKLRPNISSKWKRYHGILFPLEQILQ